MTRPTVTHFLNVVSVFITWNAWPDATENACFEVEDKLKTAIDIRKFFPPISHITIPKLNV